MYKIYDNTGCVVSASEYRHDMYAHAINLVSLNTTSSEENIFCVVGTYIRCPCWCCWLPMKVPQKPFYDWWHIFNTFVLTCEVAFRTTHEKKMKSLFDTEGFVPVDSLCGVVGLPSKLTKFLIGGTGDI